MMPLWNEIEGRTLADGSVLGTLLRSEGRIAWFAATSAEGRPAVISVFEALNDEEAVAARLQAAAALKHPHLLGLGPVTITRLEDESLVHVEMEHFDQTLADVLRERPLTTDEAREVTESLLSALEAAEAAGLRHGHVDASGVLGVGDSIKLRSDCLAPSHGDSDAPALAALLYNALTTRRFASERDAMQLPAPFSSMVRAGAGSGGSLAAMRRVLTGPVVTTQSISTPAPATPTPLIAAAATTPSTPAGEDSRPASAAPARVPASKPAAPTSRAQGATLPRRPGVAIAAGVLMIILLAIFWLAFRRPPGHTPVSGQASITAAPATVADAPATKATPTAAEQNAAAMGSASPSPAAPPSHALPSAAPAVAPVVNGKERGIWHVVAYTYAREEAARKKADELAAKYPQLEPQVFSPTGRSPYLVTLGGGTDRESAYGRRDAARKAGLPRDTYAQNFRK